MRDKKIAKTFFIAVLFAAVIYPSLSVAQQGGNAAAILPAESQDIDSLTLQVIDSALEEEVARLGYTLVDKEMIAKARPDSCLSMSCSETVDFLNLGKNLSADIVLHPVVKKSAQDVVVSLGVYEIHSGSVNAASKTVKASSLLLAIKEMVQDVLIEAGPPPTAPAPPPPGGVTEPEPSPPAPPEKPPETGPEKPVEKPSEAIEPPGQVEDEEKKVPPPEEEKPEKKEKPDQSGRVPVIVTSGILAMALGTGILLAADVDDWRIYLPVVLLGGATGVVVSLIATKKFKVTRGDAAMFDAVIAWSLVNGLLIPGAAGSGEVSKIALGGTIGGAIGLAGGITVMALTDPYPGDALLLSIAGFWGAAYAEMITGLIQPDEGNKYFIAGLVGLDIGLLAGGLMSVWLDVSPVRSGITTLVGLGGAALGALAGVAFIAKDDPSPNEWKIFTGILLAGTTLGVIGGVFISEIVEKKLEEKRKKKGKKGEDRQAALPYLVYHTPDGWWVGMPAIMPITAGKSVGVHTSLLGGVF